MEETNKTITQNKLWCPMALLALATLIAIMCFIYLGHDESKLQASEQQIQTSGSLEATEVTAAFKVPGKIAKIVVDEGSEVKAGQVLAVLESKEIDAKAKAAAAASEIATVKISQAQTIAGMQREQSNSQVLLAESLLREAEEALDAVEKSYRRSESLYTAGALSKQVFDEVTAKYQSAQEKVSQAHSNLAIASTGQQQVSLREADINSARAGLEQAQAAVQETKAYLDNTVLRAPIAGKVTLRTMEPGEMVAAGTPVIIISDLSNTWVKVYIDEQKISQVSLGQKGQVVFDAFPRRTFSAKVVSINPAGEFATRKAINEQRDHDIKAFAVKIKVPNPDNELKAGMTAYVKLAPAIGGKN